MAAIALACAPLFAPAPVRADLSLGQAGSFTALGTTISLGGGVTINGSTGIGPNGSLTTNGSLQTFNGAIDVDPSASTHFNNFGGNNPPTVSMSLSQAISDINTASTNYAALSPTQVMASLSSTTITGTGGVNVIDVTSIGGGVTLKGTNSDYFIINVSGAVDFEGASGVILKDLSGTTNAADGVLASHVLFNVVGNVTLGSGNTVYGTFLSKNGQMNIGGSSTIYGALLDGNSSVTLSAQANTVVNGTGNLFVAPTPEPSTLALAFSGVAALGLVRLVRRHRNA